MRVAGRDFLPHLYSRSGSQNRLGQTRMTPLQPLLSHPSDFLTEILNLSPLKLNRTPPQRRSKFTNLLSLPPFTLHRSVSPPYPTSRSRMLLMTGLPLASHSRTLPTTNLPPTPRSWFHMIHSTSRMGTSKYCAGTRFSVSPSAFYPSTLLPFVGCSLKSTWLRQNLPTVVLVSLPQTQPRISPRS